MKIDERIVKAVVRKLRKSCKAGEVCRLCGNYVCPQDRAYEIMTWWRERK